MRFVNIGRWNISLGMLCAAYGIKEEALLVGFSISLDDALVRGRSFRKIPLLRRHECGVLLL
jgi:hypothetical protein